MCDDLVRHYSHGISDCNCEYGVKCFDESVTQKMISCPATLHYDEDNQCEGLPLIYATEKAACADLSVPRTIIIMPHETVKIDLLVSFSIPERFKVLLYPRSSLLLKYGIIAPVSVIDEDYSGQHVHAILHNLNNKNVQLEQGTRVLQAECVPAYTTEEWIRMDNKRTGGMGSTGV